MGNTQDYHSSIEAWLAQPPSLVASGFGRRIGPALNPLWRVGRQLVPVAVFEQALMNGSRASRRLTLRDRFLQQRDVASVSALRAMSLAEADASWRRERRWALGLAGTSGAVAGVGGAFTLALDIPALILQAFVVIHRCGLCYGYDSADAAAPGYALGIFALASANTLAEKQAAWQTLEQLGSLQAEALRDGLEAAVARQLGKGSVAAGMQSLARQLGMNVGRRKAAAAVPVLGAVIGGSINAWVMADLLQVARHVFVARRIGLLPEPPV